MYQLLGAAALAKWFTVLAGAVGVLTMVAALLLGKPEPSGAFPLGWWVWTSLGTGTTVASLLLFGVGNSSLFPRLCRLRVLRGTFPDLDGTWQGMLESNWPRVSQRQADGTLPPLLPVAATLRVKARLLSVTVTMSTDTKYSDSETVAVGVSKSAGDVPCLTYVYRNRTPNPQPTDTGVHHGAARLELRDEDGTPTLRGTCWTDRMWQNGLNTAGLAVFRKGQAGEPSPAANA